MSYWDDWEDPGNDWSGPERFDGGPRRRNKKKRKHYKTEAGTALCGANVLNPAKFADPNGKYQTVTCPDCRAKLEAGE